MRLAAYSLRGLRLALCIVAVTHSEARCQALRPGIAVFGGVAAPVGSSTGSYGTGGAVAAGVGVAPAASRFGFRFEGSFVRLAGVEYAGIDFPAVKMIPVLGSVRLTLGKAVVAPYVLGGAGAAFVHHNVSYDGYTPSFAGLIGAGVRLGQGPAAPLLELRYLRVSTPIAATSFISLAAGFTLGRY